MAEERLELENAEITRQRKFLDTTYVIRPNKDIPFDFNSSYSQNDSNLSAHETLSTSKVNFRSPVLVDHYGRSLPLMAEERLELENAEITRQTKLLDTTYVIRPNKLHLTLTPVHLFPLQQRKP